MEIAELRKGGKRIIILGSIYGLVSDGKSVRAKLEIEKPEIVALGISREDLQALGDAECEDIYDVYFKGLERFGEVSLPSPDLLAAIDYSKKHSARLVAIDLTDDEYSEALCSNVSTLQVIAFSRRKIRGVKSTSAADFSLRWDLKKHREKGFKKINEISERIMSERIFDLNRKEGKIVAIIDLPRFESMIRMVNTS